MNRGRGGSGGGDESTEVFQALFCSVAEEMGVLLMRSSASPNIKERLDFSCALFTADGELFAQAAHIPVHLGSAPLSVRAAMAAHEFEPGDAVVLNDPDRGGTHLPDITLVSAVFLRGRRRPDFYVATRAHHADVGGYQPGSMASCPDVFGEGLRIPPLLLLRGGERDPALWSLVLANVRTPQERQIDLLAQCAANRRAVERLGELAERFGADSLERAAARLLDYGERRMRALLRALPDGRVRHRELLDDDGQGREDLRLEVQLEVRGERAVLDFSATEEQCAGSLNANAAITWSAVLYCFQCLLGGGASPNEGMGRPLELVLRKGTLVDPFPGAAIAGGNVETSQRLVDLVFGALAKLAPGKIPACSQGTMNNLTIGRAGHEGAFTYYETTAGGCGAGPSRAGASGLQVHMTNTRNTPIEALELAYPLRVVRTKLARGTGGRGARTGGDGVVREIELLEPARVSVLTERRRHPPSGVAGGGPGTLGRNWIVRSGRRERRPGKFTETLQAGDRVGLQSPGGGGHGRPAKGGTRR